MNLVLVSSSFSTSLALLVTTKQFTEVDQGYMWFWVWAPSRMPHHDARFHINDCWWCGTPGSHDDENGGESMDGHIVWVVALCSIRWVSWLADFARAKHDWFSGWRCDLKLQSKLSIVTSYVWVSAIINQEIAPNRSYTRNIFEKWRDLYYAYCHKLLFHASYSFSLTARFVIQWFTMSDDFIIQWFAITADSVIR